MLKVFWGHQIQHHVVVTQCLFSWVLFILTTELTCLIFYGFFPTRVLPNGPAQLLNDTKSSFSVSMLMWKILLVISFTVVSSFN